MPRPLVASINCGTEQPRPEARCKHLTVWLRRERERDRESVCVCVRGLGVRVGGGCTILERESSRGRQVRVHWMGPPDLSCV